MDRYQLVSHKQISQTEVCQECHEWWHIELRRYHDHNNNQTDATVETSVRTACACTPEVDPYADWNRKGKPEVIDVSRGRPTLQPILEFPVERPKTIVDDILQYDEKD